MSKKLARRLEMARDLEGRGHLDHAAKAYLRAARPDEAARLFESLGRPADAAKAYVDAVALFGKAISPELSEDGRAIVELACSLYREARRDTEAAALEASLAGSAPPIPVASFDEGESESSEARPSSASAVRPPESATRPPSPSVDPEEIAGRPRSVAGARPPSPSVDPEEIVGRPRSTSGRPPSPTVDPLEIAGAPRRPASVSVTGPGVHRPSRPAIEESVGVHRSRPVSEEAIGRPSSRPGPARPLTRPSSFTVVRPLGTPPSSPRTAPEPAPARTAPEPTPEVPPAQPRPASTSAFRPFTPPPEEPPKAIPPPAAPAEARAFQPFTPPATPSEPATSRPVERPASTESRAPRLADVGSSPPGGSPARGSLPTGMTRGPVGAPEKGDFARAAGWRDVDGTEMEKTITSMLEQGKKGAAARVAMEAGQHERALAWFLELELFHHAGLCLKTLGRPEEALQAILQLSLGDTRYRRACFDVIELARTTGRLDFEVDRFLTRFVVDGPADPQENAAFVELANLFGQFGFPEGARRCAEAVLRTSPDDVGAQMVLAAHPIPAKTKRRSTRPPRPAFSGKLPSLDAYRELVKAHAPK
ncbi:MAG: hypothetical protein H6721_04445 [Sandaracinus sp.]|nr:hypothetical protein [Sandaracinus sp.]MCB9620535.1 hypothetical protein [Sandaracinus sp.]MCB9631375.1 hypothetical protein [Sandaracinus sp.]